MRKQQLNSAAWPLTATLTLRCKSNIRGNYVRKPHGKIRKKNLDEENNHVGSLLGRGRTHKKIVALSHSLCVFVCAGLTDWEWSVAAAVAAAGLRVERRRLWPAPRLYAAARRTRAPAAGATSTGGPRGQGSSPSPFWVRWRPAAICANWAVTDLAPRQIYIGRIQEMRNGPSPLSLSLGRTKSRFQPLELLFIEAFKRDKCSSGKLFTFSEKCVLAVRFCPTSDSWCDNTEENNWRFFFFN